jgi:hypothetical protein
VGDLARRQLALDLESDASQEARPRLKPRQALTGPHAADPIAHLEQVVVKPIIDLDQCLEVASDDVPERIAEHVALRDRTCVFPWCTRPARSCHPDQPDDHPCDCDHVHPRSQGGPTCSCNLAALCRRHHRLKTHAPWTYLALDPGTYLWTSPHGYQFLRDPAGTLDVTPARPCPAAPPDT